MMKIFVSNNVVLLILVITTTIDASRLFYLPLPKIHPSHQQIPTPNIIPETTKKSISDEFVPSSAVEYEEMLKRGDTFDWEALVDRETAAKRRIAVNELSPVTLKHLDEQIDDSDTQAAVDKAQFNHEQFLAEQLLQNSPIERAERLQSNAAINSASKRDRRNEKLLIVIVGTCCMVGVVGLVAAATFWYKIQKRAESAADAEYPSYGVTGPNSGGGKISPSSTMSDRKLAQSAQMFHYQQQRQQMMAQEKAHLDAKPVNSDDSDDEAPGGGDYTVYECPGLAPTGEMEVRNPLFAEPDSSLASNSHPTTNNHYPQPSSPPKEKSLP